MLDEGGKKTEKRLKKLVKFAYKLTDVAKSTSAREQNMTPIRKDKDGQINTNMISSMLMDHEP